MRVYLYFIGKPRDRAANQMAAGFLDRSQHYARCEMREIAPGRFDPWSRHPSGLKILLDPRGKPLDSGGFTALIERSASEGRDLVFVVGGADGLPPGWKPRADLLLSLSPMTFPHELARVMLAEQLYRAFATLRGHPYPR
jgi:23S rRNA (pseudouridine1915-N3)-methyltransferase